MEESDQTSTSKARPTRRKFLKLAAGGACALVLGDALVYEPHAVEVREIFLSSGKLPSGSELRLVHLSDLHLPALNGYYREVASTANSLQPHLYLLSGDFVTYNRNLEGVGKFLRMLRAPLGIFAVQGNWEYHTRLFGEPLRRKFAAWGTTLLIDERRDLQWRGCPISVLGLDYPSSRRSLDRLQPQIDGQRLNLLMSHVPAFSHDRLEGKTDLIFCGHTHGGQVRVPYLPPLFLPPHCGKFLSGLYRVGRSTTPLYVTRGIGTSAIPARFLCRPEITLFRLGSGEKTMVRES
jgi:predicted MPP superfamily phosphohydrolase